MITDESRFDLESTGFGSVRKGKVYGLNSRTSTELTKLVHMFAGKSSEDFENYCRDEHKSYRYKAKYMKLLEDSFCHVITPTSSKESRPSVTQDYLMQKIDALENQIQQQTRMIETLMSILQSKTIVEEKDTTENKEPAIVEDEDDTALASNPCYISEEGGYTPKKMSPERKAALINSLKAAGMNLII